MTTAEFLRAAKARLEEDGWTQGEFGVDRSPHCVVGALVRVRDALGDVQIGAPEAFLARAVGRHSIIAWNDAPGRTVEEVYAAFDKAIALAEAEEG
ncbi:MAG: hypothetical protein C4558_06295 [Dehalococcoidia bacterium]|nr:MAG: hypothetical protein C4558_06295 [Dehalococcoidia bacterium]